MKDNKEYIRECRKTSKELENTAGTLSMIYAVSIICSVAISIFVLSGLVKNSLYIFIIGALGLCFTLIPLILKKNIEKVHGYSELSIEFKNLEQDFISGKNSSKSLNKLKKLRKKIPNFPTKFSKCF